MNQSPERWLPVLGFEGLYDVSDQGRLRSYSTYHHPGATEPHILTPYSNGRYKKACLRKDGVATTPNVHNLVAQAFLGPRPPGSQIAHNDGDKSNNALTNLRYTSPKDNANDRIQHGQQVRGEAHPQHKLTESQVLEMRARYSAGGVTQKELAVQFAVSRALVSFVVTRRTWTHVA